MKAFVQNLISGNPGYIQVGVTIYDGNNVVADANIPFSPSTLTTEASIHDAIITAVLGFATTNSLTIAATDIYFNGITPKSNEGTTLRMGMKSYFGHATVASGVAVFQLTDDGLSTGNAIFPNGIIADSVNPTVSDATASYQMSWALSNGNKTLTVTTNKLTTANILTGLLGQTAANGAVLKIGVWGY